MEVKRQTGFQRVLYNEAKKGAYYTDKEHCKWLSNLFEWPKEEFCIIEPSIGDGEAVSTVISKDATDQKVVFGVELDERVYENQKSNPSIKHLINADFLNGVKISNESFTFCFGNPPYGQDVYEKERLEYNFLKKVTKYLKAKAVLVWVVPYYVFQDEPKYAAFFNANFEVVHIYKFHEEEFNKYKQIVIIGIKRPGGPLRDQEESNKLYRKVMDIDTLPLVPIAYDGPKINIIPSKEQDITYFSSKEFKSDEALDFLLSQSAVYKEIVTSTKHKDVLLKEIGQPPVELSPSHMYLLAVCGYTSSFKMGSEENKDIHLQRGKVDNIEKASYETKENGSVIKTVRSSAHTKLTIIENDGDIKVLD